MGCGKTACNLLGKRCEAKNAWSCLIYFICHCQSSHAIYSLLAITGFCLLYVSYVKLGRHKVENVLQRKRRDMEQARDTCEEKDYTTCKTYTHSDFHKATCPCNYKTYRSNFSLTRPFGTTPAKKKTGEPPAKKKEEHTGRTKERQKDIDKGFKAGGKGVGKLAKKLMHASEFKKTAMKMAQAAMVDSMADGSMAEEALNATREIVEKYFKKALKAIDKEIAKHHSDSMPKGINQIMDHATNPNKALTKVLEKMGDIHEDMLDKFIQEFKGAQRTSAMTDALDGFNERHGINVPQEDSVDTINWSQLDAVDNILDAIDKDGEKKNI